ncbi:hypothetical protein [Micromonospora sp. NPDC023956]|uniref:hypothetical protein n=1 Tax=Micromonospora sp. NPDC023956 TaxID=3155722 RepID=UPI0033EEA75C
MRLKKFRVSITDDNGTSMAAVELIMTTEQADAFVYVGELLDRQVPPVKLHTVEVPA